MRSYSLCSIHYCINRDPGFRKNKNPWNAFHPILSELANCQLPQNYLYLLCWVTGFSVGFLFNLSEGDDLSHCIHRSSCHITDKRGVEIMGGTLHQHGRRVGRHGYGWTYSGAGICSCSTPPCRNCCGCRRSLRRWSARTSSGVCRRPSAAWRRGRGQSQPPESKRLPGDSS